MSLWPLGGLFFYSSTETSNPIAALADGLDGTSVVRIRYPSAKGVCSRMNLSSGITTFFFVPTR